MLTNLIRVDHLGKLCFNSVWEMGNLTDQVYCKGDDFGAKLGGANLPREAFSHSDIFAKV